MAGIYIHIPFCKKRCTYCDFYTEVAPQLIQTLTEWLVKELYLRKDYLQEPHVQTIYFGGGTPSILKQADFKKIFDAIFDLYEVDKEAEITFEANPDDLTPDFFASIHSLPFNRISIGIQSFDDTDLKRINRRHTGKEAIEAVTNARKAGFENISIDLIYGLPSQSIDAWKKQIETACNLHVQHISAYGLTYEEGTVLWKQRENNEIAAVDDETMNEMYRILVHTLEQNGFEAYEISNFAQKGFRSRHNTSYWKMEPYIGIGPSAHSYDLNSRQWNVASINEYISKIDRNEVFFEREELTLTDRYNDYIMVSLRTSDGISTELSNKLFGIDLTAYCMQNAKRFIDNGHLEFTNGKLCLTANGILVSNIIITELMKV
jgi:oxygen-independent coproporphyrinogen-3 oxidase